MVKHLHHQIAIFLGAALLFLGVFFGIQHTPKTEASTWLLSGGTVTRNNSDFIDATFWSDDPSDDDIIKALYGSGDEGSAYTQHRTGYTSGSCLNSGMTVLYTGEMPEYLSDNTIYVLTGSTYITDTVTRAGTCSAIVSNNNNGTALYTDSNRWANILIQNNNVILDNLTINGTGGGVVPFHQTNNKCIDVGSAFNFTFNNLNAYNALSEVIRIDQGQYFGIYNSVIASNFSNGQGIRLWTDADNGIIENVHIYNSNYGFNIIGKNNIINNAHIYNNNVGIWIYNNDNIVNNVQIHNSSYGIRIYDSGSNNILNNIQVYNSTQGVKFSNYTSGNILNNIQSYNNQQGIFSEEGTQNYYFGNIDFFDNDTDIVGSGIFIAGNIGDYPELGFSEGNISTTGILSFDYLTNPSDENDYFLFNWSNNWDAIQGQKIRGASSYFNKITSKYSYGKNIFSQTAPIIYSGADLVYGSNFNPNMYIGSNVLKITGELLGLPNIATETFATVSGNSDSLLVSTYSLFGDIVNNITGIALGDDTAIELSGTDGNKRVVTQLSGSSYYATHFQENTLLEIFPPEQVVLLSPISGTVFDTGMIDLRWNVLDDNISGYVFEIVNDTGFVQSGFTTTTGVTVSLPYDNVNDDYQRRVYAIDILGATGARSDTRGFSIDTIICSDFRNNDAFITGAFWDTNPPDRCIIEALYGTTGDTDTAYTQHRTGYTSGSCIDMSVIHITTTPATITGNTIYVLSSGDYTLSTQATMEPCGAFIGNGNVSINKNAYIHAFYFGSKTNFAILDNLSINGNGNINHGVCMDDTNSNTIHTIHSFRNSIGIRLSYAFYNTIDDVIVNNNVQQGIYLSNSSNNIITHTDTYENNIGIDIYNSSTNNILSGFSSHDNTQYGLYIRSTSNNSGYNFFTYDNGGNGIYISNSSDNTLEDFSTYDNWGDGIFLDTTTGIHLHDFSSYGNAVGLWINESYGTIASRFQTYFNGRGINMDGSSYSNVSDFQSYNNNYGIQIRELSHHNRLNNFQSYNARYDGLIIDNAPFNTFNNLQIYNNNDIGIDSNSEHTTLHNANIYHNNIGIRINTENNILATTTIYNNNYGITNNISGTSYYGKNKRFGNILANTGGSYPIFTGNDPYFIGLGWNTGTMINTGTMVWDFITNPINTSGNYLLSRSGTFSSLLRLISVYETSTTQKYSYGSGILLQQQPVLYSGVELITGGTFDSTKYIGSDVIQVTGDIQIVPEYTRYTLLTLTGMSDDPLVDRYSMFGHINDYPFGRIINTFVGIQLTSGDGTKRIITQLWNDDYFATHFQKDTFLDQTPPSQVILISPLSGTIFDTGNVSLERDISIDTGAGFSGYLFEISTGIGFSEILYSGSTSDTGFSLFDLSNGTYYRRVYAIDVLGNITPSATIWNFIIELCGNSILDIGEDCDLGGLNSSTGACTTSCTWNTPSCTLSILPFTGYAPLTGIFSISDIFTGWMNFDRLDFGDDTTGEVNTGTLIYDHLYTTTGAFIGTLQVSNSYAPNVTGQCKAHIDVFTYEYCGDGIVQSPNSSGNIEVCDGEVGCDSFCQREDISCTLNISSPIYSGENTLITGTANHSRVVFSGINLGLPNILYAINDIGSYTTGHQYSSGGTYTITMDIVHPSTGGISNQCTGAIDVLRCGDDIVNGIEICDNGTDNGIICTPEYGSTCAYCSSSCNTITLTGEYCGDGIVNGLEACDGSPGCSPLCTRIVPSCTLSVSPLTGYAPLTGTFSISDVDTGWMNFDRLDFGDDTTGEVNTGTLIYDHLYPESGIFTGMLQVSNAYAPDFTGQCYATLASLCLDIAWTPDPSTICSPNVFTQTSNCGNTRQMIGTRSCGGGGGTQLRIDNCCIESGLPGANEECKDNSPSYYDDTCLPLEGHGAAPGNFCMYDDEEYITRGSFSDTKKHRGYPYIELMRLSCLHRGVGTDHNKRIYSPDTYIKKSEILKTLVKIMGIAFDDFSIGSEDQSYPYPLIFKDLSATHRFSWYSEYAYTRGLTEGLYTSSLQKMFLKPNEYVTRNDIVKKIVETYNLIHNGEVALNSGTHLIDITPSDPYYDYIRQAESIGFIHGIPHNDGTYSFNGEEFVTRAQFAKMISIPFSTLLMGEE